MRASVPALFVAVACSHHTSHPPSPVPAPAAPAAMQATVGDASSSDVTRREDLVRRAREAMDSDVPLDYSRPLSRQPLDRSRTIELLVQACEAGDARSCWEAMQLSPPHERSATAKPVVANCRGGDLLSCRALIAVGITSSGSTPLPGYQGGSRCAVPITDECDVRGLEQECVDGFLRSCEILMRTVEGDQRARWATRITELAQQGCSAGILDDCERADTRWPSDRFVEAAHMACRLSRPRCEMLAPIFDARGEPERARDALEVACQSGEDFRSSCLQLGVAYLDRKYAEPVPGRGQVLVDFACERLLPTAAKVSKDPLVRVPECKRASKRPE